MTTVIQSGKTKVICPECGAKKNEWSNIIHYRGPMNFFEGLMSIFCFGELYKNRYKCMECGCIFEQE